ncbi:LytR/AlgR family response regulator transcription factor [Polaribacter sp. Hel1_85]|uniref:LytR/AlgR family response regulator transcription factor n=1 Tax=Polaribacter sp. Hel1_85 TaxID=1250005 RepID=UPI00052CAE05|nr:LytTR family DNA-binding domain-containing protein [Polaribacter sp. Hel1_85]KGL58726.1 two-component system response regulator, LyTr family [Polaribacter sp. Hel1_85]
MNCIIIDDDATARLIIKQLCSNSEQVSVVEEFSSAIDAIKYLNSNEVDLIFLDIHMPTFSGFDFIQTLKSPPKIILSTSDKNFALQAFEYECVVDYLVKPITKARFNKSLHKLASLEEAKVSNDSYSSKEDSSFIYVSVDRRLIKINIPDIYFVEAKGDYISIKTQTKNYIVHSTLKKIEDKLPQGLFLRIHRSFIINISQIIDIEDNSVLIQKSVIPISRSNKSELMKRLNLL